MTSFWTWLVYAVLGLITISFLPKSVAYLIVVILLLGGIFYFETHQGSLQDFISTLDGTKNKGATS
jgi:hypothetical protein